MAEISHLLKDLLVSINSSNVLQPSIVWNYFDHMHKNPDQKLDTDHFYCKISLDKLKTDKPVATLSSVRKRVSIYSTSSSTGILRHHILAIHQITGSQQVKSTNEHVQSMFSRDHHGSAISHAKEGLGHQLTLMCCRDLLPFSIVDNAGNYCSLSI